MPKIAETRAAFRKLHQAGCFVMPNPWDAGSAKYLQSLSFKALATTSAGLAWSRGNDDGAITREIVLAHVAELSAAIDIPLNVDFEDGFGADAAAVGESVRLCVSVGASGLSIEDCHGPRAQALYPLDEIGGTIEGSARRDRCRRRRRYSHRAERRLHPWRARSAETIRRLKAYAAAGADCLYRAGHSNARANQGGRRVPSRLSR